MLKIGVLFFFALNVMEEHIIVSQFFALFRIKQNIPIPNYYVILN